MQATEATERSVAKEYWRREFEEEENRLVKVSVVGQGTYGMVFKAYRLKDPRRLFAVKKINLSQEREGFPITALREISLLRSLSHPNVIRFLEITSSKRGLKSERVERLQAVDADPDGLPRARPRDPADARDRLPAGGGEVHHARAAGGRGLPARQRGHPPGPEVWA